MLAHGVADLVVPGQLAVILIPVRTTLRNALICGTGGGATQLHIDKSRITAVDVGGKPGNAEIGASTLVILLRLLIEDERVDDVESKTQVIDQLWRDDVGIARCAVPRLGRGVSGIGKVDGLGEVV